MFGKKTVDSILGGFNKMVSDLERIISDEVALQVKREEEITNLKAAQMASAVEIGRAAHAIKKLNAIMNPVPMSKRLD